MKKLIFMLYFGAFVVSGCTKTAKQDLGDLGGTYNLHGIALIYDSLSGKYAYVGTHPIAVYLSYPLDSAGYLTSTMTNGLGQYAFTGIDSTKAYVVYASLDSNGVHYYGE